jgi:hypothetical protein
MNSCCWRPAKFRILKTTNQDSIYIWFVVCDLRRPFQLLIARHQFSDVRSCTSECGDERLIPIHHMLMYIYSTGKYICYPTAPLNSRTYCSSLSVLFSWILVLLNRATHLSYLLLQNVQDRPIVE